MNDLTTQIIEKTKCQIFGIGLNKECNDILLEYSELENYKNGFTVTEVYNIMLKNKDIFKGCTLYQSQVVGAFYPVNIITIVKGI